MSETIKLVVDTREPDEIKMLTLGHPDVDEWLEEELSAADIVVNGVGFERKTPSDFASSLIGGRLDEQAEKLRDVYDQRKILIEGGFDHFSSLPHTSINAQSLRGKAASLDMRYDVPVVPTGGSPDTETARRLLVDMAVRYGRKGTTEPSSDFLSVGAVGTDEPLGVRMWGCFDGIGPQRAQDLYEAVGSPTEFATMSFDFQAGHLHETAPDSLMDVDGIGEKTAVSLVEQVPLYSGRDTGSQDERAQGPTEAPDEGDA